MSHKEDLALMAHLMRRAGFGATRDELEKYVAQGYETTLEQLLYPPAERLGDKAGPFAMVTRYHPETLLPGAGTSLGAYSWIYRMVNAQRPLEEKMALFWHQVFATGNSKVDNGDQLMEQIEMFRRNAMGNYRDLLVELSKNPAMIFWLDNNENHREAVNENWGRELLELFSMGVSNYTEVDVREVSRAFTGWTIAPKLPRVPYGRFPWRFEYREEDHDEGEKTFLGQTGNFNGEDIIDIIVREPATSRFICRHLYNFFVADEPQVAAWTIEPARDEEALEMMMTVFGETGGDIKAVLQAMFMSEFFREARFTKIKSPAEMVASTLRLVGAFTFPRADMKDIGLQPAYMGQSLLDPPSVEGWHTGPEWINSGSLLARINFVADHVADPSLPGVERIIHYMKADGVTTPEQLLEASLEHMGYLKLSPETHSKFMGYAQAGGTLDWSDEAAAGKRIGEMLALIGATTEYQFG